MKKKIFYRLLLIFSLSFVLTMAVAAQENSPEMISDDEVNVVAKQLYCPVCENIPLDVCGTQACAQWRELIREKLADGWSEEEIKDYFVLQYGDRVLAEPPRRGLNLLVYVVPPVAFLAGVFILYRGIQSWRETGRDEPETEAVKPENTAGLDDYIARMEDELQRADQ
jgi:cytochrome c-type biogenesis protein CcmH